MAGAGDQVGPEVRAVQALPRAHPATQPPLASSTRRSAAQPPSHAAPPAPPCFCYSLPSPRTAPPVLPSPSRVAPERGVPASADASLSSSQPVSNPFFASYPAVTHIILLHAHFAEFLAPMLEHDTPGQTCLPA